MSKVVITSAGCLGDVAPFIPIGRRLVERGHAATLVAPVGYAGVLVTEPFTHHHFAPDFSAAAVHADPTHTKLGAGADSSPTTSASPSTSSRASDTSSKKPGRSWPNSSSTEPERIDAKARSAWV